MRRRQPPPRRWSSVAPADAALLGLLRFAERSDGLEEPSLLGFLRHGQLLCSGRITGGLVEDWRRMSTVGVSLIGEAFDPRNEMRVWGRRQETRRRELGRRLHEDDVTVVPRASHAGSPAWRAWKREAVLWSDERDRWREDARRRFAEERIRLRLEALWAEASVEPDRPGTAAHE